MKMSEKKNWKDLKMGLKRSINRNEAEKRFIFYEKMNEKEQKKFHTVES